MKFTSRFWNKGGTKLKSIQCALRLLEPEKASYEVKVPQDNMPSVWRFYTLNYETKHYFFDETFSKIKPKEK